MPENSKPIQVDAVPGEAKKKKKRSRKKKKSKNGAGDAKSSDSSADESSSYQIVAQQASRVVGTAAPPANMNPHVILRNRLIEEGFSMVQIDRAMEEMWDKNLEYDEFDAVLKYLIGNKDETQVDEKTMKKDNDDESPQVIQEEAEGGPSAEGGGRAPEEVESEDAPTERKSVKSASPMTMEQRLEMVADFENLPDAIFALTEWINKAAKPSDLEDLCARTKTEALVTIFKRSITECEDNSDNFDKFILPAMDCLMNSLLGKSGISSGAAAQTQSIFGPLMKQARTIYLMQQPDSKDFAERVSRFIVSRISLAIGESNATTGNGKQPLFAGGSSNGYIPASADNGIADILSQREINKTAAKRYGVMAGVACANLGVGPVAQTNGGSICETEIDRSDIMLALVGEDAKTSYELQKAEIEELKAQAQKEESETAKDLRTTIVELNDERGSIRQRILELKHSIERLEAYDAELCVKVNDAQAELDEETAQSSAEATSLNEEIREAAESIAFGSSVLSLVETLKSYDDSLDKAIHSSSEAKSLPNVDPLVYASQQIDVYFARCCSYFKSEHEVIDYLQKRIATSTRAVADIKIEIFECEGLGMSTTISQMKESLKAKEALIVKDTAMVGKFSEEATSMFESFLGRLEGFSAARLSLPVDILSDIQVFAQRLGLASASRLDPFLATNKSKASHPMTKDPFGTPKFGRVVSPIGTPKAAEATKVQQRTATVPKFTWATPKSTGDTGIKTSLLEIQKEELDSKTLE